MEHKDYRLAAVMFTDIVGFSRMMQEDEKGTLKTLDFHDKLVREQIDRFRGSVIKTIGDAFLAQFNTTLDAVQCSLAVQEGIREYNEAKIGKPLTLRIGVHLGDIYFYENDALGDGINIASRLQSITKPGHITISREVYSQVSGKIPMRVEQLGQVQLKNIIREVHAYEIIPGGEDNDSFAARKPVEQEPEPEPAPTYQRAAAPQRAPERGPEPTSRTTFAPSFAPPPPSPGFAQPPAFRDLRDEWRNLKRQIKEQVREQAYGGHEHYDENRRRQFEHRLRHQIQAHLPQGVHVDPSSLINQMFKDPLDDLKNEDGTPATKFEIYKQQTLRDGKQAKTAMFAHLVPYVAVNAFLIFLYSIVSPGAHPWFLYPLFGWGIGILSHWATARGKRKAAAEMAELQDATDDDVKQIKKYHGARIGISAHVASNIGVSLLLTMVWVIIGGGFPWHLIPIGGMAIGVFTHLASFLGRRSEFKEFWKTLKRGDRPRKSKPGVVEPEVDPIVKKARSLRDSIVAQAHGMKGGNPFGDDMTLTLDNYVLQIGELSAIEKELGQVVTSFNKADLEAELVTLRGKIDSTNSQTLKAEYQKSAGEVEKQVKSFSDLAEQQEILNLRMKSAMGNLQQMQIDLARIKGLSDGQKEGYFLSIKDRSEELSRYIEDYREGLKEIPD